MYRDILLIDDCDEEELFFRRGALAVDPAIRITRATGGEEALDMLRGGYRPDLIFLDIAMPRMNGFECLEILKAEEGLREIPVIVQSTASDKLTACRALELGAMSFQEKPVSIDAYEQALRVILVAS